MSEWMDIETAPKDGTPILVFGGELDGGIQLVAWLSNQGIKEWCEPGSWQDEQGGYNTALRPTYWMPLPEPPNTK